MHTDALPASVYLARTQTAPLLLYLDFDGVLHHEALYMSRRRGMYFDPEKAPAAKLFEWAYYLSEALAPHPEVRIVLSTSWVRSPGFGKALRWLPADLRELVIGGTFHRRVHGADLWLRKSFEDSPRGHQVCADVGRRQPLDWLALDDDIEGWPEGALGNLIACDGSVGLASVETRARLGARLADMAENLAHERAQEISRAQSPAMR